MASNNEILPEGTDTIIPGTGTGATNDGLATPVSSGSAGAEPGSTGTASIRDKIGETTAGLRGQATDKARDWASQGKDKAAGALDNVVKLIDDAAGTVDEKVGEKYGAYARQAAQSISGLAASMRDKDVDDLVRDARDAVRKSPALAIGAAAAVGFLLARAIKAASTPAGGDQTAAGDTTSPTAPSVPDRPQA